MADNNVTVTTKSNRPFYRLRAFWITILISSLLVLSGLVITGYSRTILALLGQETTYVTILAAIGIVTPVIIAVMSTLGKMTEKWKEMSEKWLELKEVRARLKKTEETIVREKGRNSRIELRATKAADKVEAVAVQVDKNSIDIQMMGIFIREWAEDKETITHDRETITRLTRKLSRYEPTEPNEEEETL